MNKHTDTAAPMWRPADATRALMLLGYAVALLGAAAFALSFLGVYQAAHPVFGAAAWVIPLLGDAAIALMSAFSIFAELSGLSSPTARWASRVLIAFTIYANVAHAPGIYAKVLHGAPPVVWVLIVSVFEHLVRRLAGLADESTMDKVRPSRWFLAPVSTFRLWRRMRLWEVTSYRVAIGREHERSASTALLRQWYGRGWRAKAPGPERLAVKLQGLTAEPVAELLTRASEGITAAAAAAAKPAAREAGEAVESAETQPQQAAAGPVLYPVGERPVLAPFPAFAAQRNPFARTLKALPGAHGAQVSENDAANAENERDTAVRMRREGASFQQIADALGRSKSWAFDVAGDVPIEHANGSSVA